MEDIVRFAAKHGDWSYAREVHPPEALCPFLLRVSAVVNERVDTLLPEYFNLSELNAALDSIVESGKPLSKQLSSAVRGKAARTAAAQVLESIVSEYSLDKKPTAAFKDILKIYSTRYTLKQNNRLWELQDDVGDEAPLPVDEGYQFIAKHGSWVVIKKQKVTTLTRPVDIILYLASVSSSTHNALSTFCEREVPDYTIDTLPPVDAELPGEQKAALYASFHRIMQSAKFPAHYGPAYDNIKPPKRIRGVKTK
jgi:hypothetical protein